MAINMAELKKKVTTTTVEWDGESAEIGYYAARFTPDSSPRTRTRPNSPSITRFTAPEISETVKADDLDRRLHTLEEKHGADDALAELKAKMAQKND